ncbi:MAG: hypothetical protein WC319_04480 [Candidatus Paceibacterota bacterium]|jgi:hypothetical protein
MKQKTEKLRERPTFLHRLKNRIKKLLQSKRKYKIEFGSIDPNDKTLTFKIKNSSETDIVTARLFGSVKDLFDKKQSGFIEIDVIESSHEQVKLQILSDTFFIKGMKYCVKNSSQFLNNWDMYKERVTGMLMKRRYFPLTDRHATNNLVTQIDAPNFELVVDKNTFIEIPMNPLEEMTIIFQIAAEFNFFESIKRSFWRVYGARKNKK